MRFLQQCFVIVIVLAAATHAMPAEVEKRDADPEIGDAVVIDEPEVLPDVDGGIVKRALYSYASEEGTGRAPGCLPEYAAMKEDHTMCIYEDDPDVTDLGLSAATINEILDKHNECRAGEPAKDMTMMRWDPKIAVIAQKLAQSCHKGHDEDYNRLVPDYNITIGQNWCGGVISWSKCMAHWYNEKDLWTYGGNITATIGHFTQMVNKKATHVGCGYASCYFGKSMYCNYAYGQRRNQMKKPYIMGTKCAMCPDFCDEELQICDCGDKLCKNNGNLDKATCQCKCNKPFKGDTCLEVDCSEPWDHPVCGTGKYIYDNCTKYRSLPGYCKKTCGLCPAAAK